MRRLFRLESPSHGYIEQDHFTLWINLYEVEVRSRFFICLPVEGIISIGYFEMSLWKIPHAARHTLKASFLAEQPVAS